MIDRVEQQAAVFSLMHQMGLYSTPEANGERVNEVLSLYRAEAENGGPPP